MSSHSHALFLDLLQDLSAHLPTSVLDSLQNQEQVDWWPDISPKEFAALALAKSFYKKFVDTTEPSANSAALDKFLSVNETVGTWRLEMLDSWDEVLMGELKSSVYHFWNPGGDPLVSSLDGLFSRMACGPGVAVGAAGNDFYSKLFAGPLTTTSKGLYRAYRSYIRNFPEWSNAEIIRKEHHGEGVVVEGNRLQFVPKTRDISRTICIEPSLNMSLQLGMESYLTDRLRSFFGIQFTQSDLDERRDFWHQPVVIPSKIKLDSQPDINRGLAELGSRFGLYSTIDLESASDSLSLGMLKEVLPADFFSWLELLRSPSVLLPDGRRVALNMVSTMGNGFTFPLQTMLFACVVTAAARARGFHLERPRAASEGTYSVFGDDIIIPTGIHYIKYQKWDAGLKTYVPISECINYGDTLVRDVLRLLRMLGFRVNSSKSFFEGPFRESCGADYFRGQRVRGVYLKTLKTTQSRFVAVNLLNRWSSVTGIRLTRTVRRLLRSVPFYAVPPWESDDAGVKVPYSLVKYRRLDKHTNSILYRKYVVKPTYVLIDEGRIFGRKSLTYNPSGLMISFLQGTIRSCKIGVRSHSNIYRLCYGIAPEWDYVVADVADATGTRWKTAVISNHSE